MAKGRKYYRRKYQKAKRKQSKGGIMGYRLMDIGQGLYNADALGYIDAVTWLAAGDYKTAATSITDPLADTAGLLGLTVDNVLIGFNRKMLRKFGGKFIRKFIS